MRIYVPGEPLVDEIWEMPGMVIATWVEQQPARPTGPRRLRVRASRDRPAAAPAVVTFGAPFWGWCRSVRRSMIGTEKSRHVPPPHDEEIDEDEDDNRDPVLDYDT